jgi:DNA repair exonuclease SbcCD ATPase subunit
MNHQHGQGDDSFWPSFTDIMSVIVIIFLLAMVVVMLRNSELIQQLRLMVQAEREAAELIRKTASEKENLAVRLIDVEQQLSMLRMELMHMTEKRDTLKNTLSNRDAELRQIKSDYAESQSTLQQVRHELELESDRLLQANAQLDQVTENRDNLLDQLTDSRNKLTDLQREHEEQNRQLRAVMLEADEVSSKLAVLGGEYDELKMKYDKLVRPARTPRGKYVVEVRKSKSAGKVNLSMKLPGQSGFKTVTESNMHQRLQQLKTKHPKTLYIKIIFPEDSGLSYNEAWGFTSELHRKYDYYYQE